MRGNAWLLKLPPTSGRNLLFPLPPLIVYPHVPPYSSSYHYVFNFSHLRIWTLPSEKSRLLRFVLIFCSSQNLSCSKKSKFNQCQTSLFFNKKTFEKEKLKMLMFWYYDKLMIHWFVWFYVFLDWLGRILFKIPALPKFSL